MKGKQKMEQEKINEILKLHKKWLDNESNGVCADLYDADLDSSCFPLWCGGLDVHIDDKQAKQLLYHLIRNVQYSKNVSDEVKAIICTPELIALANEFHRVNECGKIAIEGKANE